MALDNYLPRDTLPSAQLPDGEQSEGFEWTPSQDAPSAADPYMRWRAPGASLSVTLWDEVAPGIPRETQDAADDSSEA